MLLLLESEVAYPCITVHLMKLRNVLTVDRVGSRRPHRSVNALTQWLKGLVTAWKRMLRARPKSSHFLSFRIACTILAVDAIIVLHRAIA